jgi:hypothetical protein
VSCQYCVQARCTNCAFKCENCQIGVPTRCVTCSADSFRLFNAASNDCVCLQGFFEQGVSVCGKCHYTCLTCNGGLETSCLSCSANSQLNRIPTPVSGMCSCVNGYFDAGQQFCEVCSQNCRSCSKNPFFCTNCTSLFYLLDGVCLQACPNGYFTQLTTNTCVVCVVGCAICTIDFVCLSCVEPRFLFGSVCSFSCPKATIRVDQSCQLCAPNQVHFNDTCLDTCPFQTFVADSSLLCEPTIKTTFLLNFTYYVQTPSGLSLYFFATTKITNSTLRASFLDVYMNDFPSSGSTRNLQYLTPYPIQQLRLITNNTYLLTLGTVPRRFNNTRVDLRIKNLSQVFD